MATTTALPAQQVLASFEVHSNGIRYAWLGEDGDSAVVFGHGRDPRLVAEALDLGYDDLELTEQWMIGSEHSQGCDGPPTDDVCGPCQARQHDACNPSEFYGCECADGDHDVDLAVSCGCDEYAWWGEYLTADQAAAQPDHAIAVTTWRG